MVGKTKGRKVGWIASSDLSRNDTEIISRCLRSIKVRDEVSSATAWFPSLLA